MHYVYILQSKKNGRLYKGLTTNISTRLKEHNSGSVTSTKAYKPWKLVYYEAFSCKRDAEEKEKFLKTGKGRERIRFLLQHTIRRGA